MEENLSEKLKECLRANEGVVAVYIFGSMATGSFTKYSDIDLAVLMKEPFTPKNVLLLSARVSLILKTDKIDLLVLNTAPVFLSFRVLKEGKLLFCYNEDVLASFIESSLRNYFDFGYQLKEFYKEYQHSLLATYGN